MVILQVKSSSFLIQFIQRHAQKYCQTNKCNVVTYSSQIRPVLDLSSKSFSKVSSPKKLYRGTSICPAVPKSLSTGADEGRVVLYLMKAFRTFRYLFGILSTQQAYIPSNAASLTLDVDAHPPDIVLLTQFADFQPLYRHLHQFFSNCFPIQQVK